MKKKGFGGRYLAIFWVNSWLSCLHTVFNRWSNNEKKFTKLNSNQPLGPSIGIFCTEYFIIFYMYLFLIWEGEEYFLCMIKHFHSNCEECAWRETVKYTYKEGTSPGEYVVPVLSLGFNFMGTNWRGYSFFQSYFNVILCFNIC